MRGVSKKNARVWLWSGFLYPVSSSFVQPIAFGVSFLDPHLCIDNLVLWVSFAKETYNFIEQKRPINSIGWSVIS